MTDKKNIIVRVDAEYHQKLKIYLAQQNKTMQDYIVSLINEDMKNKEVTAK